MRDHRSILASDCELHNEEHLTQCDQVVGNQSGQWSRRAGLEQRDLVKRSKCHFSPAYCIPGQECSARSGCRIGGLIVVPFVSVDVVPKQGNRLVSRRAPNLEHVALRSRKKEGVRGNPTHVFTHHISDLMYLSEARTRKLNRAEAGRNGTDMLRPCHPSKWARLSEIILLKRQCVGKGRLEMQGIPRIYRSVDMEHYTRSSIYA